MLPPANFYRWLQTTLSYVAPDPVPDEIISVDIESESNFKDSAFYQLQVAKLTLIESNNFRRIREEDFSMVSSRAIRESLNGWLQELPEEIELQNLEAASLDPETRISALYLHSFYLGGEMLSYRWILSWVMRQRQSGNNVTQELEQEAARWADDGIPAAKKSTELLYALYTTGAAVRHRWFCMYVPLLCKYSWANIPQFSRLPLMLHTSV